MKKLIINNQLFALYEIEGNKLFLKIQPVVNLHLTTDQKHEIFCIQTISVVENAKFEAVYFLNV